MLESEDLYHIIVLVCSICFGSRYGPEVEHYLEVYLKTPNLSKADLARALLARGNARKEAGDRLLAKANLGM